MPMHTHTKAKVYASRHPDGKIKEISIMNPKTGKKIMEIHTHNHKGMGMHVHHWEPGKAPRGNPSPLTKGQRKYLENLSRKTETEK